MSRESQASAWPNSMTLLCLGHKQKTRFVCDVSDSRRALFWKTDMVMAALLGIDCWWAFFLLAKWNLLGVFIYYEYLSSNIKMCISRGWKSQNNLAHSLKNGYWHKTRWFCPFFGGDFVKATSNWAQFFLTSHIIYTSFYHWAKVFWPSFEFSSQG